MTAEQSANIRRWAVEAYMGMCAANDFMPTADKVVEEASKLAQYVMTGTS